MSRARQGSDVFSLILDGTTYKITVDGNSVLVNGQPFVVGLEDQSETRSQGGMERVLVDGIPYDVSLSPEGDRVVVGGITYELQVEGLEREQPGHVVSAEARPGTAAGAGAVRAIMPGKIIRLLVAEGDAVGEGDVVCILEAMKMENELKAPQAGTVKALYIQPGQDVESGAVLAEIA